MKGWQRQAGCRGVDPELFFPTGKDTSDVVSNHLRAVRPICSACPVARECLRWAIETGQQHGLWAATTPSQRRRARRQRRGWGRAGGEQTRELEAIPGTHPVPPADTAALALSLALSPASALAAVGQR